VLVDDLLEVQRVDTTLDQLAYRRAHLPERDEAAGAASAMAAVERRRGELSTRNDELDAAVEGLEREGGSLTAQKRRLEAQLKTVIAPREAEALMHELDTLARRRDELDDQELAHLEEQSAIIDELAALDAQLPEVRSRVDAARGALAAAEAAVDGEVADLGAARSEVAARIDGGLQRRYEQLRARFGGVAIARLEGSRCGGCHLDLSTTELADVRGVPAGEMAECPQCGRLLVP
jgi:predicted  nucleic acid-binding Zn-ribbon protein